MTDPRARYPDISDILARKAAGRLHNASLTFSEKLGILDALRERAAPFTRARKGREAKQPDSRRETNRK
jgi:hypothetical protein